MKDYLLEPKQLAANGIHTVIIGSPDLQGRLVGRRVPVESFDRVVDEGVEVCTAVYGWDVTQGLDLIETDALDVCSTANGIPDVTFRPDLSTLRRAAWLDGVAVCLADPYDPRRDEYLPLSPRTILKQQIARLKDLGLHAKTGTELEFYLFHNEPRELREAGFHGLRPTTAIPADFQIHEGNTFEPFFRGLRTALYDSGIEVEAAQSEWGTGQWEMTFRYGDPLEMADRHLLYKLAVRDYATAAGMSATFMARPLNGQPGSSCHVHLSVVDDDGKPVFSDGASPATPTDTMTHAVGGVLAHTPEFMAWYAPTVNSYRRINSHEVAGWGLTWGMDNRTTSVRIVGRRPQDLRLEFRLPGADTNPYLTLAALLASVRDGVQNSITPPAMTTGNGYATAVDPTFPRHLGDSSAALRHSSFLRTELGDSVVEHFATLTDFEWDSFLGVVSGWDLDRYFDRI